MGNNTEKEDAQLSNEIRENLKLSSEWAREDFKSEADRCDRLDHKVDCLLFFVVAQLIGLDFLSPLSEGIREICFVFLILFLGCIVASVICALKAIFPRPNKVNKPESYNNDAINSQSQGLLLNGYLDAMVKSIKSFREANSKKVKFIKGAFICSAISFLIFIIMLLIKIL